MAVRAVPRPGAVRPAGYEHRDTESRTTSVVAGYVYAGTALPSLEGQYVFGDLFRNGRGHIFTVW